MILVDAHVHIYDCFDLEEFLDSAFYNFKSAAEQNNAGDNFVGILLLAETYKDNWFRDLSDSLPNEESKTVWKPGNWIFHFAEENTAIYARHGMSKKLVIIAGRQIVTREGLEVIALLTNMHVKDGMPIDSLIKEIRERSGIPLIPWGFAKWFGKRGKILYRLLNQPNDFQFVLGDNGGRAAFIPRPKFFNVADQKGIRIFPGSDPMPLKTEYSRAGSFGFLANVSLPEKEPANFIKSIIDNSSVKFEPYGNLLGLYPFLKNQFLLRLKSFGF